jgi:radical SAM superfamily enzyme YgiQ (UPF0313 family)
VPQPLTTTDIVLIQPPIRDFYLTAKRTFPYGLACIGAALREEGYTVTLTDALATSKSRPLDLPPEMDYLEEYYGREDRSPFCLFHRYRHYGYAFEHVARLAAASQAFLIGIASLFTAYSQEALETARAVRAACPQASIVLGGHHPTALPRDVMDCEAVDFVIRGEGEAALPKLAAALQKNTSLEGVPGLVFRKENGELHIAEPALTADLDSSPPPAIDLVRRSFYQRSRRGSAVVVTSRGCPMGCSYCVLGSDIFPYRRRSVCAVMAEIETAVDQWGAGFIDFEDENLSLERKWFTELLARIRRRYGRRLELRAMNGLFPPSLDAGLIATMQSAGFRTLNLSLGTRSAAQQQQFRRPDVHRSFENAVSSAHRLGMQSVGYVIAAAPGQRAQDSLADLLYLANKPVLAAVSIFYPAPGSRDYDRCREKGLLPPRASLMRSSALPVEDVTTRLQSITLLRLSRLLNFMKRLIRMGEAIPRPQALAADSQVPVGNRGELGKRLLAAWRHDGRIRGVSPEGKVFDQTVDARLSQRFLAKLSIEKIRG